jgi:hypothetical protein
MSTKANIAAAVVAVLITPVPAPAKALTGRLQATSGAFAAATKPLRTARSAQRNGVAQTSMGVEVGWSRRVGGGWSCRRRRSRRRDPLPTSTGWRYGARLGRRWGRYVIAQLDLSAFLAMASPKRSKLRTGAVEEILRLLFERLAWLAFQPKIGEPLTLPVVDSLAHGSLRSRPRTLPSGCFPTCGTIHFEQLPELVLRTLMRENPRFCKMASRPTFSSASSSSKARPKK